MTFAHYRLYVFQPATVISLEQQMATQLIVIVKQVNVCATKQQT